MLKEEKMNFQVGEEKIEFMLAKLVKSPSVRDYCRLVDIIDTYVKESAYGHLLIDGLEAWFLNGTKIDKGNNEQEFMRKYLTKVYFTLTQALKFL